MDNPVYNTPKEAVASSISNFEIEPINIRIPTPENIKIKLIRKISHKTVIIIMLKTKMLAARALAVVGVTAEMQDKSCAAIFLAFS